MELATQKAGVLFTTSRLKRLSDEIEDLKSKYNELQSNLVKEIISITAGYFPVFERLNALIAHLDVLLRFVASSNSVCCIFLISLLSSILALLMFLLMPPYLLLDPNYSKRVPVMLFSRNRGILVWKCRMEFRLLQIMLKCFEVISVYYLITRSIILRGTNIRRFKQISNNYRSKHGRKIYIH